MCCTTRFSLSLIVTTKFSGSPKASNLALANLRTCSMYAIKSRIHVLCLQKLKTLLFTSNFLQNHINSKFSLVSCFGTNNWLNYGFYSDKLSRMAQNKYVKTHNLSTHQLCYWLDVELNF